MTGPSGITGGTAGTARVGRTGSARAVRPVGRPGGPDAPRPGGLRPDGGRPGSGPADAGRADHGRADAPDARLVDGARGWPRVVAVALLVLAVPAALLPLLPVVDPPVLVRVGGIGAVLGAAFALLTTWRRWGAALTLAALVVGYLGGGMIAVAPPWRAGASLGASLMALLGGIVTSWKDGLTLTPPIGEVPGVLVAPWLLSFAGTALVVVLGLRGRASAPAAGLVPPVVLPAALVLGDARAVLPAVLGVAIGAVGIVAAGLLRGARMQRPVSLAVLLVIPIVAGLATPWALAPLDRLVVRDQVVPPFDPAAYESPLATFRKFVKADDDVELEISGDTAADVAGTRLRTAVMDSYDGVVWTTSVSSGTGGQSSGDFRRVAGERAVVGDPVALDVTVRGLTGVWLPTVGSMRSFDATPELRDALRYNDATTSAVLVDGLSEGDTYRIEAAVEPAVEDAALADVGVADVDLGPVTGVPEVVGLVAREWVGAADTPIVMARALEQRLAGSGYYSDGLTEGTPAGHGADRMTTLLESDLMVGNGEQYASAMALMARELGLPARVVMGFDVPVDGEAGPDGSYPVHGRDVDAWVEIAFDGVGWVPFYPTPDKSRTPDTSEVVTDPENQPLVTQPRPTQPPPTQAPTAEPNDVRPQDRPDPEPEDAGAGWVWAVAGATAGGLLLLAVPFLVVLAAKAARARARRSDPDPRRRAAGAWAEVVALATDVRRAPPPTATRREAAADLGAFALDTAAAQEEAWVEAGAGRGPSGAGGRGASGRRGAFGGRGASAGATGAAGAGTAAGAGSDPGVGTVWGPGAAPADPWAAPADPWAAPEDPWAAPRPPAEGPAARAAATAHALDVVAARADAAQFGPYEPTPEQGAEAWRAAGEVRTGLLGQLSRWQRLRAQVSIRSLRRRG